MRKFSKVISMMKGDYNKETIAKKIADAEITPWKEGETIEVSDVDY